MQLQLCFGISIRSLGDMEMEESHWQSKRLPLVCGHLEHTACTAVTAVRFCAEKKRERKKIKSRRVRGVGGGK